MSTKLNTTSLATNFPLSFRDYSDDASIHVQVGSGWAELLEQACLQIEIYLQKQQRLAPNLPLPRIVQIKEKMGSLRINMLPCDDFLAQIRLHALQQSERVCEHCGSQLKWRNIHEAGCMAARQSDSASSQPGR